MVRLLPFVCFPITLGSVDELYCRHEILAVWELVEKGPGQRRVKPDPQGQTPPCRSLSLPTLMPDALQEKLAPLPRSCMTWGSEKPGTTKEPDAPLGPSWRGNSRLLQSCLWAVCSGKCRCSLAQTPQDTATPFWGKGEGVLLCRVANCFGAQGSAWD